MLCGIIICLIVAFMFCRSMHLANIHWVVVHYTSVEIKKSMIIKLVHVRLRIKSNIFNKNRIRDCLIIF